jgi:hypothetical protein
MFVCKDKRKDGSAGQLRVFHSEPKQRKDYYEHMVYYSECDDEFTEEVVSEDGLEDMPAGTCVEITWATLQGKRRDDDEPLTMEFVRQVATVIHNEELSDLSNYILFACGGVKVDLWHNHRVNAFWYAAGVGRDHFIKTRGQFRALCKALGIEVKEVV